jgi:hypothetical protein
MPIFLYFIFGLSFSLTASHRITEASGMWYFSHSLSLIPKSATRSNITFIMLPGHNEGVMPIKCSDPFVALLARRMVCLDLLERDTA